MNPNTNHLTSFEVYDGSVVPQGYEILPDGLQQAAKMKLNGRTDAYVSRNSGGKLSNWAKDKRKAKIAAASKRKNRK